MSLVTPDSGLLFWMVIIFGLLFFLLAKFGFPIITSMVEKRDRAIGQSLKDAKEVEARMTALVEEHSKMLEETKKEQSAIMKEATEAKKALVEQAKAEAREEADKILADARIRIAAEKESALKDVRREVALLSVSIAEKILRKDLSSDQSGAEFISKMIDEAEKTSDKLS